MRQNQYYASDSDESDISEEEVASRNHTVAHASERLNGEPYEAQATRPAEEGLLGGRSTDAGSGPVMQELRKLRRLDLLSVQIQRESTDGQSSSPAQLVSEASVVDRPLFFPEPFETRLPYRVVSRMGDKKYSGVMLDEERIVGLAVSDVPFSLIGRRWIDRICW